MKPEDLEHFNRKLSGNSTEEILSWANREFGDGLVVTSSFQTQSVPLLHLVSKHAPDARVIFLNTGFHFPETIQFKDGLTNLFSLNVEEWQCLVGREAFEEEHGELYRSDPHRCCHLNKVEPLKKALATASAWISGIRKDQTAIRAQSEIIQLTNEGVVKICPMLDWTGEEIRDYVAQNHLPTHPLLNQGYLSIGCAPCTRPASAQDHERAGRWLGLQKVECGLHTEI